MGDAEWAVGSGRALVLLPYAKGRDEGRTPQARLEEAQGLARAIGLSVVRADAFVLARPKAGTLLGTGRVAEIATYVGANEIEVVVMDTALSPVQ